MEKKSLEYIRACATNIEGILPHNLPDFCMSELSSEAEKIKERVDEDGVAEGFVNIVMLINGYRGKTSMEHDDIIKDLEIYVKIFSLERLKRLGFVKKYEEPTIDNIFDESREFDVVIDKSGRI